jgi:hypothetical protein
MTRFEAATRTAHAATYAVGAFALAASSPWTGWWGSWWASST